MHPTTYLVGSGIQKITYSGTQKNFYILHTVINYNNCLFTLKGTAQAGEHQKSMMDKIFFEQRNIDHSPHNLFVEMDELINDEWVEQSRFVSQFQYYFFVSIYQLFVYIHKIYRWIKYEEAREPGSERWGKPHVSSLSFHSLLNLR